MRIGFLTAELATEDKPRGGLGNYLNRISIALSRAGHEPHIFFYTSGPTSVKIKQGVHIHQVNDSPGIFSKIINRKPINLRQTLLALERANRLGKYIANFHKQTPLDILQAPNSLVPGLMAPNKIPLVIRASSYRPYWDKFDHVRQSLDRRIYAQLEVIQYRKAAGIYTPSKLLKEILRRELGIQGVHIIPTIYFQEIWNWNKALLDRDLADKPYLLFFGRLSPQKGAHILAQALQKVWQEFPDLVAVFVGKDTNYDKQNRMSDVIRKICMGHEHNLIIYPRLPHRNLYPLIKHSRLVVLPSFIENMPNSMLEAMGFAKPVIGTYGSSMDEFIDDGHSGFLVPSGDPESLAAKICDVWERCDLSEIGQAAQEKTKQLSPEKILPELISFYRNILVDSKWC